GVAELDAVAAVAADEVQAGRGAVADGVAGGEGPEEDAVELVAQRAAAARGDADPVAQQGVARGAGPGDLDAVRVVAGAEVERDEDAPGVHDVDAVGRVAHVGGAGGAGADEVAQHGDVGAGVVEADAVAVVVTDDVAGGGGGAADGHVGGAVD